MAEDAYQTTPLARAGCAQGSLARHAACTGWRQVGGGGTLLRLGQGVAGGGQGPGLWSERQVHSLHDLPLSFSLAGPVLAAGGTWPTAALAGREQGGGGGASGGGAGGEGAGGGGGEAATGAAALPTGLPGAAPAEEDCEEDGDEYEEERELGSDQDVQLLEAEAAAADEVAPAHVTDFFWTASPGAVDRKILFQGPGGILPDTCYVRIRRCRYRATAHGAFAELGASVWLLHVKAYPLGVGRAGASFG